MSRRPSVSIHNYPEDLNPFNDEGTTITTAKPTSGTRESNVDAKNSSREPKHKFWTFGRSKKKQRSNSFSIKSTWSGLFGKRKDSQEVELRKPTIATVSSTYKRGTYNGYPVAPARLSRDQQEFDEALGTLARRRKYTLDNSSRYSSTLTVNADPGRIYDGSPQDTTTSIMGDLTPKAPARRFGQVSPRPTDKIPPLDYRDKDRTNNGDAVLDERTPNPTPVPPKRGGPRSSQRSLAPSLVNEDVSSRSTDVSIRDENENVPEDYVFKRFNHDAIRKSNLSINSCVSVGSTVSAYGRKKRRAPQPPRIKEPLDVPKENDPRPLGVEHSNVVLQIVEPIDITRVTENIDEMTTRSRELDENSALTCSGKSNKDDGEVSTNNNRNNSSVSLEKPETAPDAVRSERDDEVASELWIISNGGATVGPEAEEGASSGATPEAACTDFCGEGSRMEETTEMEEARIQNNEIETDVEVELRRKPEVAKIEVTRDIERTISTEDLPLRRRTSSGNLSRSDSFSVKEEIEKIERQIKILEAINVSEAKEDDTKGAFERASTRRSLRETRKNFFRNMADEERVKVKLTELPREQNDIKIVRIEDPPIAIEGPTDPVKIIELHISEPIKEKPAIVIDRDVNPIPKPRRHSNFDPVDKDARVKVRHEKEDDEKRGNSL